MRFEIADYVGLEGDERIFQVAGNRGNKRLMLVEEKNNVYLFADEDEVVALTRETLVRRRSAA